MKKISILIVSLLFIMVAHHEALAKQIKGKFTAEGKGGAVGKGSFTAGPKGGIAITPNGNVHKIAPGETVEGKGVALGSGIVSGKGVARGKGTATRP